MTDTTYEASEPVDGDQVVDTTETVPAGTLTTSDQETDIPDEPVEVDEDEDDDLDEDEFPDALGTVREGAYDVPWTYLTAEHLSDAGHTVRTSDTDDGNVVKWNVQHAFEGEDDDAVVALVAVQATPGQTFHVSELPDIQSLVKAGIDPVQYLSGLPVRNSLGDDEVHRRGIPA